MECWRCQNVYAEAIGEEMRFCPDCGARLYQDCPYCNEGNSVYENICTNPSCNKPFIRCEACNILYTIDKYTCTECESYLSNNCESNMAYNSNLYRDNSININKGTFANPVPSKDYGRKQISCTVSHYGRLYFWCKDGASWRLKAYNPFTNEEIWNNKANCTQKEIKNPDELVLEIYKNYILTYNEDSVYINSVLDGKEIADIKLQFEDYRVAILQNTLLVLGIKGTNQFLKLYSLNASVKELREIPLEKCRKRNGICGYPVVIEDSVYFADFGGKLLKFNTTGEHEEIFSLSEERGGVIEQFTCNESRIIMLVKDDSDKYMIRVFDTSENNETMRSSPMDLAVPSIAYCSKENMIITCELRREGKQFHAYKLDSLNWRSTWKNNVMVNSEVEDFLILSSNDKNILVFLLHSSVGQYCTHAVEIGSDNLIKIQPMMQGSNASILYVDGVIVSVERALGKMYFKKFP